MWKLSKVSFQGGYGIAMLSSCFSYYSHFFLCVPMRIEFRVLHRIVKMMMHNDKNLETFFEKTAQQPPKVDIEKSKLAKDMENIEKWQNEMVTSEDSEFSHHHS